MGPKTSDKVKMRISSIEFFRTIAIFAIIVPMVLRFSNPKGRLLGGGAGFDIVNRQKIPLKENEMQKICREVLKFNAMCGRMVWRNRYTKKYTIKNIGILIQKFSEKKLSLTSAVMNLSARRSIKLNPWHLVTFY